MSAPFFILLPGGAKNFSICEKAETSWLTSSLVALKVDDGHSLKARGAFEAIWIDQSQISIWITEEEEKQWKGEVRGLEKQDLLYSSMLMDQCQDIILTIYTSQQASLLNQIRKLIFKTIYNFNNKTIFDPFVFRDSLTNSDHGQWTIPHPYSYTHTLHKHTEITVMSGSDIVQPQSSFLRHSSPGRMIWTARHHIPEWEPYHICSGSRCSCQVCHWAQTVYSMDDPKLQTQESIWKFQSTCYWFLSYCTLPIRNINRTNNYFSISKFWQHDNYTYMYVYNVCLYIYNTYS